MRFLPSIALLLFAVSTADAASIDWHEDLRQAHAVAQREDKPLLLHFTTDHCVYCDRLEAGAYQSAEVQSAIATGYVPVKIHAGRQPQLAKMFKVSRFPTDVIVTTGGEALVHRVSPQEPEKYTAMLDGPIMQLAKLRKQPAAPPVAAATPPMSRDNNKQVAQTSATGGASGFEAPVTAGGMMPPMGPSGPPARPASSQIASMTLPPAPPVAAPQRSASASQHSASAPTARVPASSNPTLALEGYCVVSLINGHDWVQGNPQFGVVHLGQLYLFTSQQNMETFLDNPVPYTPMLNGIDVVRFFEERKIVPGKREFSAVDPDHNRIFVFADEDALAHFENTFERYVDSAIAVMDKAITQSNPQSVR